jgi:Glycosyl transferases group 1
MKQRALRSPRAKRDLRVVVTRPPDDWFYGLAHQYAALYAQCFDDLGAEVLAVPVAPFVTQDREAIRELVGQIRRFRPDLAIGLHDAGYALYCRAPRRPELTPTNIFVDWLELPTILLWDHAMLQFAPVLLGGLPDHPDDSVAGCLEFFRAELSHPLFVHVARDSGHREVAHELGVVPRERVLLEPSSAHPHLSNGHGPPSTRRADVAFFGHLRPLALESRPARHHAALVELREAALAGKVDRLDTPVLEDVVAAVDELPAPLRASMRLHPDESFYWSVLCGEMAVAQTSLRRALLEGLSREIVFYGDYGAHDAGGRVRLNSARFPFGAELGRAFAATGVTVDFVNPGFLHGFGTKVMNCFAAGGFMLLDRKRDFVELFGELGEAVSFSSLDELRAKLDYYLAEEKARLAISEALGARIREHHSLPGLLRRVTDAALDARASAT